MWRDQKSMTSRNRRNKGENIMIFNKMKKDGNPQEPERVAENYGSLLDKLAKSQNPIFADDPVDFNR
jgi:hypothetical protein